MPNEKRQLRVEIAADAHQLLRLIAAKRDCSYTEALEFALRYTGAHYGFVGDKKDPPDARDIAGATDG